MYKDIKRELAEGILDLAIFAGVYDYEEQPNGHGIYIWDLEDPEDVSSATYDNIADAFHRIAKMDTYPSKEVRKAIEHAEDDMPYLGMLDPMSALAVLELGVWEEIVSG